MQNFPYQSLLGTLMHSMLGTHGDIAYAVGALSKVASNPGKAHWDEAVHVLHYLAGTHDYCLVFDHKKAGEMTSFILGYSDSDWAGDLDA